MFRFFSNLEDRINLQEFSQVSAALAGCCYRLVRWWCEDELAEGERTECGPLFLKRCREAPNSDCLIYYFAQPLLKVGE